jgi:glycosyltransferase involved in cell wall biosynthesis
MQRELRDRLRAIAGEQVVRSVAARAGSALPRVRAFLGLEDGASPGGSVVLQVVFAQYDRKKYAGSLERLLGLLSNLSGLDYHVLVVDNLRPGHWSHEVSDRLAHIGGDNSAWEFSAFDKGLAHLDRAGARADVYALVTDAFTAYGADFLSLITKEVFEFAARRRSVIGWVDAWPRPTIVFGKPTAEWVRTSFVVLPAPHLAVIRPLAFPFDPRSMFSGDPAAPFAAGAPVGPELSRFIVEWLSGVKGEQQLSEGWHSQFELDRARLPFFESKASAILREQLLSVHLRDAGVPCFDFRLLRRVHEGGRLVYDIEPGTLARFAWTHWADPDDLGTLSRLRHHLDRLEIPRTISHGDPATVLVEGWVLAATPPTVIKLHVGPKSFVARRDLPRDDVASAFPSAKVGRPGFVVSGSLRELPVGVHDVVLDIGGHVVPLGRVETIPLVDTTGLHGVVPSSWPRGRNIPIAVYGELRSSFTATAVSVQLDGNPANVPTFLGAALPEPNGVFTQEITVNGYSGAIDTPGPHLLEVRLTLSNGSEQSLTYPFVVGAAEHPCTLRNLSIGPFDPNAGLTNIGIEVDVFDVEPGDHLVLERDGRTVLESPVAASGGGAGLPRRGIVCVERRVEGVPAGTSPFALLLRRQRERYTLFRGELQVRFLHPEIHLERLSATVHRSSSASTHRLSLGGWIKNHFLVDCLHVAVDDGHAATVGLHDLRPDVASVMNDPIVSRQGFDAHVDVADVAPGEHVVHVIAMQSDGERVRVSRRVFFDDIPARRMTVVSDDIERLRRGEHLHFYSSIALRGIIHIQMDEATVALLVDDRVADEQIYDGAGRHEFRLRAVPTSSGEHEIRFLVSTRGRVLFATDPVKVWFRRIELPAALVDDVGTLLEHFELRSKMLGRPSDEELTSRLIEWQPERISEFTEMIAESAARVRTSNGGSRRYREPPPAAFGRRLKVLLATWEVPSRYHGGGVYLTNLITRLGARHDVTLVHTCGLDEAGHVEAVRPYVRRIITVPRVFRPAQYRGAGRFPLFLYDVYLPELRRILELEVASGGYDLVDYQYSSMGPYVIRGVPSVLTVLETGYTALLNTLFQRASESQASIGDLDQFIRSFHYYTSELPTLCRHLVNLTKEDADAIAAFSDAHVYVNHAGVDVDVEELRPERQRRAPILAYVGNFQHPPNGRAVTFFATQVMPELLRRYPGAQLRVYGSRISAEVSELDGRNGVRVEGFVEDLHTALRDATAMVAPLFTGTGMRIKVLEAFGAGALVIGTDLSVRGIPVVDGQHFYRANTAGEFARAVSRAFESPNEAASVARAGRDLVGSTYSWDAVARRQEAIWQSILTESEALTGSTPPSPADRSTISARRTPGMGR